MAQATFVYDGCHVDYTPGGALAAGDVVVQNSLLGVTPRPLVASVLQMLLVEGVFDFTKQSGVAVAIGELVYWDDSNNYANKTSGGNTLIGKAVAAAGTGDATVRVRLDQ